MSSKVVLIGAGGTGGHVIPAMSISKQLLKDGFHPIIVGSGKILEIVKKTGIETVQIETASLSANPMKAMKFLKKMKKGISQSKALIKKYQPVAVLGMGGYPSAPLVLAARKKVPILLHEQNAVAGRANRFLSKYADIVMVAFEGTTGLPKKKIEIVGNPLRWTDIPIHSADAYESLNLDPSKKTILIVGGSQGAKYLNLGFLNLSEKLVGRDDLQWIVITGKRMFEEVQTEVKKKKFKNVRVLDYLASMDKAYSVADLAITRSGAMTVSELECLGLPSIQVPKSNSIYNHQMKNARYLKSKTKNVEILDEKTLTYTLEESIESSLGLQKEPSKNCIHRESVITISEIIQSLVRS